MKFNSLLLVSAIFFSASYEVESTQNTLVFEEGLKNDLLWQSFQRYKLEYNKIYSNQEEEHKRFQAWTTNLERVQKHNSDNSFTFTLAMNHLAGHIMLITFSILIKNYYIIKIDLTDDEYRSMLGYSKRNNEKKVDATMTITSDSYGGNAPEKWDWREKNVIANVKNQGQCGSCWSFSAVAALEGLLANVTGKITELSEQELVDCVKGGIDDCQHGGEMQVV